MKAVVTPAVSAAAEINRLHAIAVRHAIDSTNLLWLALSAAWQAGQLLVAEKKSVQRRMGHGAWLLWLQQNFDGSLRTAQRYMCLARSITDPSFVRGLSLRQAYFRLGIATEPKCRQETVTVEPLPEPIRLASRLIRVLRTKKASEVRDDLRPLYEHLRQLFESPNKLLLTGSIAPCPVASR